MRRSFFSLGLLVIFISQSPAQTTHPTRLAILEFGNTRIGKITTEQLRTGFRSIPQLQLIDADLSATAARGVGYTGSLNMPTIDARDLGAAMDAEFFILGDAQTLRRSSSENSTYYESYFSLFVISSRSGRLVYWDRLSAEADNPNAAEEKLAGTYSGKKPVERCLAAIRSAQVNESSQRAVTLEAVAPLIQEAPEDDKIADAQGLRLPRPYRRLRPAYPESAARAGVEATVDVLVDVGADGEVNRVEVARWAGFGLDETTLATVRQLHFFPAMRDGVPIPMRVLLRYNFRKPAP